MDKFYGNGWDGILYPSSNNKEKIMIVFSGSDGGLEHACKCCKYLQDHGVPSFALGYFKTTHSPKNLNLIRVDIFEEVIRKLKELGYKKIGVEGVSKGAELALAAAIQYSDISCVIIKTPSFFYSEGLRNGQPSNNSCWSYRGKEYPFTPYKDRKFHTLKMLWKEKEYNILEVNVNKEIKEESIIQVEKIQAPILMFSTKVDTIWPSYESCLKLCNRLNSNHFSYPFEHISFDHMSHMMMEYCGKGIKYFMKSEKEYPNECAKEREMMGNKCIQWIKEVW